jgi:hypothetical protein
VGAFSQDSRHGVDENMNGETYHNAWPYLKELGLESITQTVDYSTSFNDMGNFTISQYESNWIDHIGACFSPYSYFWRDLERHVVPSNWAGKKTCILFGRDKPVLYYSRDFLSTALPSGNMKLNSFCFMDAPVTSYGNSIGFEKCDRISFYWDPTFPEILIKQLHVLKKVYEINLTASYDKDLGANILSGMTTNQIIYNLKRPLAFKSAKNKSKILSSRDNFMLNKQDSKIYQMYSSGINLINQIVGINNMSSVIRSKFYGIY